MSAYYNEIDPYAAQWLRNLIAAGHIAPGDVDERSITEVHPDDLRGYKQCHFFAGIGGWSYALRLAGWPDDRPVWTGSCPCQPFSTAGRQRGSDDERHLWPAFLRLIAERRPGTVFGEQVAGAAGLAWWDHVAADLEGAGYAAAAANIGAHSVGAPHIRQRLYWLAHSDRAGSLLGQRDCEQQQPEQPAPRGHDADGCGEVCGRLGNAGSEGLEVERRFPGVPRGAGAAGAGQAAVGADALAAGGMGHSSSVGHGGGSTHCAGQPTEVSCARHEVLDAWRDVEWLACSDGKARPTQPGLFPLAHGIPNRVGRLRAYGNAIVPQVAAAFIEAAV